MQKIKMVITRKNLTGSCQEKDYYKGGSPSFSENWQGNEAKDDCIINTYLIGIIYKMH